MAVPRTYRGFSTYQAERTRTWVRSDIDLIKVDLLNHFYTRVGERLGRPDWGCLIWDLLHEQMDQTIRDQIINEAVRIVSSDPRCKLINVNLFDFDNGIRIECTLDFIGLATMQTFAVDFERRESAANGGLEF